MTTQKLLKISRWTALFSLIVGSALFWTYYIAEYGEFILIGILYVFIAGVVNIILITLVHSRWTKDQTERKELFRTGMLMLLNIPVFLFYLVMTSKLLGTIRLTLTNETSSKLTSIEINGCEHKKISDLMIVKKLKYGLAFLLTVMLRFPI